jgi:hypothetical protein
MRLLARVGRTPSGIGRSEGGMIMEGLGGIRSARAAAPFRADWQQTKPLNDIGTAAAQDLFMERYSRIF